MGLDTVELVISWEEHFSIEIPNEVAATLTTPKKASAAIEKLLVEAGRPTDRSEIDRIVRDCTLEISGIRAPEYNPDGKFVEDFGLD